MLRGRCAACLVALLLPAAVRAAEDPIFDVAALTSTPLNARTLRAREAGGIVTEEVRFHSERDGGKDVDIFAYFSYPKGARKRPAYVWNPGGLSQASPAYTEAGARRGYATLCIDFPLPGYRSTGAYPIHSGLDVGADPRQAPIFHGAVALLKAVSYLEGRPEVDRDRIGMAGASWGGFYTTLMTGIDRRLKVASCLYGTGNLQLGNAWWDGQSRNGRASPGPAEREHWRVTLDPAWRLPHVRTPIAWLTGTNDGFYLLPSVMRSYERAPGPKHLMLLPNWDHALPPALHDQVFVWLDTYLQGKPPPPRLTPVVVRNEGGRLVARWSADADSTAADLIASYGPPTSWRGRYWHTFRAHINGRACRAELPAGTLPCFVSGSAVDRRGYRSSTPLVRVDAAALGVTARVPVPDYDGCAEWGGFEPAQIAFLRRHTQSGQPRWVPQVSTDAREGKQSAVLPAGRTVLPPPLGTPTVPHRFACFLKAERPTEVTVAVAGRERRFRVGTAWVEVGVEVMPPTDVMGQIPASLTVPAGSAVLVDGVSFRPVLGGKR